MIAECDCAKPNKIFIRQYSFASQDRAFVLVRRFDIHSIISDCQSVFFLLLLKKKKKENQEMVY